MFNNYFDLQIMDNISKEIYHAYLKTPFFYRSRNSIMEKVSRAEKPFDVLSDYDYIMTIRYCPLVKYLWKSFQKEINPYCRPWIILQEKKKKS